MGEMKYSSEYCKGFQSRHEVTDYHRGEYDVVKWVCKHCDGAGRRRKITKYEKLIS